MAEKKRAGTARRADDSMTARPAQLRSRAARSAAPANAGSETIRIGGRVFAGHRAAIDGHRLDVLPDLPDIRDRIYQPHLRPLPPTLLTAVPFAARHQHDANSCTGFALAQVVDILRGKDNAAVSAQMLYEMAKLNDEWAGTVYEGSSIRGAIKGFFRNGVCSEALAPPVGPGAAWSLNYAQAKEAREVRLGAYYRLQPDITDYHAAIADVGAIYVSAQIHRNWNRPVAGRIEPGGAPVGGHAFAIVGYDAEGFLVLNSWGPSWGDGGVALWTYADWAATVMDAWVLQLGVRAPEAFGAIPRATPASSSGRLGFGDPNRSDIIGHFVNIDDGRWVRSGKYASPSAEETEVTVRRLTMAGSNDGKGYNHLVVYAHGGLNGLADEAERIATWKRNDVFGVNRIYHMHLMWGSGFLDEAFGSLSESSAGRAAGAVSDWFFETAGRELGRRAWRNMKLDAQVAFDGSEDYDGGFKALKPLFDGLDAAERRPKLHLVGHSAGSIVLGRLLSALGRFGLSNMELAGIHLMAPACTVDFFKAHYGPYLSGDGARPLTGKVWLYNLSDALERDDKVGLPVPFTPQYSKSLLYLVSRAYEESAKMPLAGMQMHAGDLPPSNRLSIDYASSAATRSVSHGGFDNDPATLTTIMTRIVGGALERAPTADQLTGY